MGRRGNGAGRAIALAGGLLAVAVAVQLLLRPGPADWVVCRDGARVEAASGDVRIVVWPAVVRSGSPEIVLRALAGRIWPGAEWESVGPLRIRAERGADAAVAYLLDRTFTFLSAPADRLSGEQSDLEGVAASFSIDGAPGRSFIAWTDPNEAAFTVEVPEGWTARGGLVRPAPHVEQFYVEARSGDARVWIGDYLPLYMLPARETEGSQRLDAGGYPWIVEPYAPGAAAAMPFLPEDATVVRTERLTGLGDAGWIEFTAGGRRGVALCVTRRDGATWRIERFYLAEAPEERFADALVALARMAETLRDDAPARVLRGAADACDAAVGRTWPTVERVVDPVTGAAAVFETA